MVGLHTSVKGNAQVGRTRRRLVIGCCSLLACFTPAGAQPQSQIQYTYDAVGNLARVARALQPDLTVSDLSVGTITVLTSGAYAIPVSFKVNNVGNATAMASWTDRGYLSLDSTLDEADEALSGYITRSAPLSPNASYTVNATLTTSAGTAAGNYTLFIKADGGTVNGPPLLAGPNDVSEWLETNNTRSTTITLPGKTADFEISNVSFGAVSATQSGAYSFPVTFTVTNVGPVSGPSTLYTSAYLSTDATLDNADQPVGYHRRDGALTSGASYTATQTMSTTAATSAGTYTLFVKADGRGAAIGSGTNTDSGYVTESNEANNTRSIPLTLASKPDLAISDVSVGTLGISQAGAYSIPISFTVTNIGELAAQPNFYTMAYLSSDGVLDNADLNLNGYVLRNTALAPGASYSATSTFTTAATTPSGSYTLFVKADGHGTAVGGSNTSNGYLAEINEANNIAAIPLVLPTKPDLVASNVSVGAITASQAGSYQIPLTFTVSNVGALSAQPNFYSAAYLSTDATLDNADLNLNGTVLRSVPLAAGASFVVTQTYSTAATTPSGSYTVFVKADGRGATIAGSNTDAGYVSEADETNNTMALGIVLPSRADLVISSASLVTLVKNWDNSRSITVTFTVTNQGALAAPPPWYDLAYLSADSVLDNSDVNLSGYSTANAALAAGASYTVTKTYLASASIPAGAYSLILKADGRGATIGGANADSGYVAESNETNNVWVIPITLP